MRSSDGATEASASPAAAASRSVPAVVTAKEEANWVNSKAGGDTASLPSLARELLSTAGSERRTVSGVDNFDVILLEDDAVDDVDTQLASAPASAGLETSLLSPSTITAVGTQAAQPHPASTLRVKKPDPVAAIAAASTRQPPHTPTPVAAAATAKSGFSFSGAISSASSRWGLTKPPAVPTTGGAVTEVVLTKGGITSTLLLSAATPPAVTPGGAAATLSLPPLYPPTQSPSPSGGGKPAAPPRALNPAGDGAAGTVDGIFGNVDIDDDDDGENDDGGEDDGIDSTAPASTSSDAVVQFGFGAVASASGLLRRALKGLGKHVARTAASAAVALSLAPTSAISISSVQLGEYAAQLREVGELVGVLAAWERAAAVGRAMARSRSAATAAIVPYDSGATAARSGEGRGGPASSALLRALLAGRPRPGRPVPTDTTGTTGNDAGEGGPTPASSTGTPPPPTEESDGAWAAPYYSTWEEHCAYLWSQSGVREGWEALTLTLEDFVAPIVLEDVRILLQRHVHKHSDALRRAANGS